MRFPKILVLSLAIGIGGLVILWLPARSLLVQISRQENCACGGRNVHREKLGVL